MLVIFIAKQMQTTNCQSLIRFSISSLVLFLVALSINPASANAIDFQDKLSKELQEIEKIVNLDSIDESVLSGLVDKITSAKIEANNCVMNTQERIKGSQRNIDLLGEENVTEPEKVKEKRESLKKAKTTLEKQLANCRLLLLRSDEALNIVNKRQRQKLSEHLFAKGTPVLTIIQNTVKEIPSWLLTTARFLTDGSGFEKFSWLQWGVFVAVLLASLLAGIYLRNKSVQSAENRNWNEQLSGKLGCAFAVTYSYYLPHLIIATALSVALFIMTYSVKPTPFITLASYCLVGYVNAIALLRVLFKPVKPGVIFWEIDSSVAKRLYRRLYIVVVILLLSMLLYLTVAAQGLPNSAKTISMGVFIAVGVVNLVWAVFLFKKVDGLFQHKWLRILVYVLLICSIGLYWSGYQNLALTLLWYLLGTSIVLTVARLLHRLYTEFCDSFGKGAYAWQRRLRSIINLKPGESVPGLIWARLAGLILLWSVVVWILLLLYGLSGEAMLQLRTLYFQGFKIGPITIIPSRIFIALLSLTVLITCSAWLKRRMENVWLPKTPMERGAAEALVTISGYLGITVAILVALSIAGFEFTNLAIVAGALSVGIGFGLQNVVNNFVSGLILLFERPVKTGDWIVVGTTEGYVKRIRIRSTLIQTFDRADVIVPNSELISGQVTNWMLKDASGRAKIPIGVAYGSDTGLVRDLLLKIAEQQSDVIIDGSKPEPFVLFLGFGTSSLDFELRCHIKNIDRRLRVLSEINFAIDDAFRKHGIEIPFPQRDVHVRDWPEVLPAPKNSDKE